MQQRRPTPEQIAVKRAQIAAGYADQARAKFGPLTLAAIRLAELNRLYRFRHGDGPLPCCDASIQLAKIVINHIGRLRYADRRIDRWLDHYTPWLDLASRERLARQALEKPLRYGAVKLGWKLRLTTEDRAMCRIKTIAAFDQSPQQREDVAKAKRRDRDRAKRRASGVLPRDQYEAQSTSRRQPWAAEGISRRTWYRRRRPSGGTGNPTSISLPVDI